MTTQTARSAWFAVDQAPAVSRAPISPAPRRPWGAIALSVLGTACLAIAAALLVGLVLSGCVSAETRKAAEELDAQVGVNRRASAPKPGIDPVEWEKGQAHAVGLAARVKQGVQ